MKKYLENVPDENYFKLCLGIELRSLEELEVALESMSDKTFKFHVNSEKNDFQAWIQEVIKDEKLTTALENIKDRDKYLAEVRKRIDEIKKTVKPDTITATKTEIAVEPHMSEHGSTTLKDFLVGLLLGIVIGVIIGSVLPALG